MKQYTYEVTKYNDDDIIHSGHIEALNTKEARAEIAKLYCLQYLRHGEYYLDDVAYQIWILG